MGSVGVRELRDRLSYYLRRVRTGEHLIVTERGKSVAVLSPPIARARDARIEAMVREGVADWGGGKQSGSMRPARVKGPTMARTVSEGRR